MTLPDLVPVEGDEPGPSADGSTENLAGPDVFQDEASQGGTDHVTPPAEIEEPLSTKVLEDLPGVEHEMEESEENIVVTPAAEIEEPASTKALEDLPVVEHEMEESEENIVVTPAAEIEEPASTKALEDLPAVEHEMEESEENIVVTPAAEIEEPASTKVMEHLPPVVEHEMKESEVISSSEGPSREGDSSYELRDENSVHESPGDEMLQVKRKTRSSDRDTLAKRKTSSSDRDTLAKRTRSSSTEAISSESTNQRCEKKRPSTASPLPTKRKLRSS
ncbi:hypothetical protein OXX80_012848 [Metschnikowia pulcherrima]